MGKKVFRIDQGELKSPKITSQGYLKADAFATRSGIFPYLLKDGSIRRELRPPEEVFRLDSLETMKSVAITNDHPPIQLDADNTKTYQVGHTGEKIDQIGIYMKVPVTITEKKSVDDVMNGKTQMSAGYLCDIEMTPGEWEGEFYDAIQRNICYNHLSIVDFGRAGPEAKIKMDSDDLFLNSEDGVMIIVNISSEEDPEEECLEQTEVEGLGESDVEDQPEEEMEMENENEDDKNKKSASISDPEKKSDGVRINFVRPSTKTNKGEQKMPVKITLDSVEYNLPDTLSAFAQGVAEKLDSLKKIKEESVSLKADLEKATGKIDGLNAELEKEKSKKMSDKEMAVHAKARLDCIDFAKKVEATFTEDSETIDIKKATISKVYPTNKLDGKSVEYIEGVYDSIISNADLTANPESKKLEQLIGQNVNDGILSDSEAKKKKLDQGTREAWKPVGK